MRCIIVIALSILVILSAIGNTMACACTFIYYPVCGSDGYTYGNPCALRCQGSVTKVKNGAC